jgi:hypothetical protein
VRCTPGRHVAVALIHVAVALRHVIVALNHVAVALIGAVDTPMLPPTVAENRAL